MAKELFSDGSGLSVDTELVVGDKNQSAQLGDSQVADTINNDNKQTADVIKNTNVSTGILLLLVLGWVLPTPATMIVWLFSKIPFIGKKSK